MDKIFIEATVETPSVRIDEEIGLVEIMGNSTMEDPVKFYQKIFDYLSKYLKNPEKELNINFKLAYFNTSSSKWIFQMLKILEGGFKKGNKIVINWYCEEDDEVMMEAGEDFKSLLKMPFYVIEE